MFRNMILLKGHRRFRRTLEGFAFISPWLFGFLFLTAGPMARLPLYQWHIVDDAVIAAAGSVWRITVDY